MSLRTRLVKKIRLGGTRWLGRDELRYALEQLDRGEAEEVVRRRLRDWAHEARRVAIAESREARAHDHQPPEYDD